MPITFAIRVFSLLLTFFGALNLVILALFGVGAAVALLAEIAGKVGKSKH